MRRTLGPIGARLMGAVALACVAGGAVADPMAVSFVAPSVVIDDFSGACGGILVCAGAAAEVGDVLRVVPAARDQAGAAWLATPVSLSATTGFISTFKFRLDVDDAMRADGLAFVVAGDPLSLGDPSRYGGSMGFEGVGQSLAVEFDSFDNGEPGRDNHVALARDGVLGNLAWANPYGVAHCPDAEGVAGCIANGRVWTATVAYDGAAGRLSVAVQDEGADKIVVIDGFAVDLRDVVGGSQAYVGFAAGTGDGILDHDVLEWNFATTAAADAAAATVPEPGTLALLGVALTGLAMRRRRG